MYIKSFQFTRVIVQEYSNGCEDRAAVFDNPKLAAVRAKVWSGFEQVNVFVLRVEFAIVLFKYPFD